MGPIASGASTPIRCGCWTRNWNHEQEIIAKLPRIATISAPMCRAHYDEVKRQLGLRGDGLIKENWRLVRGLDYYMRTTFEITAHGLGSQNAVCGGGRYDGLVELLGGPPDEGHRICDWRRPPDSFSAGAGKATRRRTCQ